MARKRRGDKKPNRDSLSLTSQPPLFSWWGRKMIFVGVLAVILGFWVLSASDPLGRNWASWVSPALILGGYLLIALGIILPPSSPPFFS